METRSIKFIIYFFIVFMATMTFLHTKSYAVNATSKQNLEHGIQNATQNFSSQELENLFESAKDNSTIKLSREYYNVYSIPIDGGRHLTLDLNNHNIILSKGHVFAVLNGELRITGHGTIWGETESTVISVNGSDTDIANYSSLIVGEGVEIRQHGRASGIMINPQFYSGTSSYGTVVDVAGEISIINDNTANTNYAGILIGGDNNKNAKNLPKIVLRPSSNIIPDSFKTSNSYGVLSVTPCNIEAEGNITFCDSCFNLNSGNLVLSNGQYVSYHAPINYYNDNEKYDSSIIIKNGVFINNDGGDCIRVITDIGKTNISINGGVFSARPDLYLVRGKKSVWDNNDKLFHVINDPAISSHDDCPSAKFTDVNKSESHWTHKAIDYVLEKGYMTGIGPFSFYPEGTVTRGTIAQILYAAEGKPTVSGKSKFTDVKDGKWYANAITWAATNGIVSGYGNGKFGPDNPITREQMVAIMYKYSEMKGYDLTASASLNSFADKNKISKYAVTAVTWAVGHKIISGTKNGIEPKGNATRAQIAVILQAYDNNVRK